MPATGTYTVTVPEAVEVKLAPRPGFATTAVVVVDEVTVKAPFTPAPVAPEITSVEPTGGAQPVKTVPIELVGPAVNVTVRTPLALVAIAVAATVSGTLP
jgi:hypothetical protein